MDRWKGENVRMVTQTTDVLILSGLTLGHRLKVGRMVKGWSQSETAAFATQELRRRGVTNLKVTTDNVGFLERGWRINRRKHAAILAVLGLSADE